MLKSKLANAVSKAVKPKYLIMTLLVTSAPAFSSDENVNKEGLQDQEITRVVGIKQTLTSNIAQSTMRSEADLSSVPRSVQVINSEVMEQQDASDLSDVVQNVSNVTEHNNFGGTRDLFKIRGFEANVYEDGTRVYGVAQDKAVIEDLESVEVVKGPESVLYGNMSPGGLINLISKRPTPIAQNQVKVTMDEHGKQRLSVDFSGPANDDGTVLYRLVGVFDDSESWRDASDSKQVFIAPSLSWLVTDDTTLTFSYKYNKEELPFDRGTLAVSDGNNGWEFLDIDEKRLGTDFSRQEREVHKFGFDIDHDINDYWSMRFKARNYERKASAERVHFYASSAASRKNGFIYGQDGAKAFDGTINRYLYGSELSSNTQLYSWENNIEFNTGSLEHRTILGADYTHYKEKEDQLASASWSQNEYAMYSKGVLHTPNTSKGSFDYYTGDPALEPHPDDLYNTRQVRQELTEYSIFAQDLIELNDWNFVLGARYDIFKAKKETIWDPTAAAAANLSNESSESPTEANISFQAGALYKLNSQVSFFGNVTDSYLPNQKFDSVKKEWVEAQNGRQFEVGSKLSLLGHKLNLTTSVFRTDLKNVAYDGDIAGSVDVYKQKVQGLEIDGDYAITDDLTALFSYGYTDVEFVDAPDSVSKPVNVPKNNASLWLTYQASHEWGVGSGIRYIDDRAGNRRKDYDYTLDAYTLVDAAIWYAPDFADNDLKLQLNVKNLFDKDYYTAGSDSTQNAVYLGSPRTVSLSAAYNF
ncbi:outer membrane ferric siderophore receptor, putative [Moritella sp. PE36]|uniref:TonB-dependent siderophore receptor n=1 Tax=Moritella sp. PE36 TaxID=58051 RepID=UPI0001568836|nr:TonB-dependent siderophore receptor [Moritella sp. PE36]EDM67938.1 outer membrane ferric siderophore receptor, putative [Moritella sp. PE36]